jgi:hypothetical protein
LMRCEWHIALRP